jgi:hypothetical protein
MYRGGCLLLVRQLSSPRSFTMKPITHVIFDLDGTILDTETLYRMAYRKVIAGRPFKKKKQLRSSAIFHLYVLKSLFIE